MRRSAVRPHLFSCLLLGAIQVPLALDVPARAQAAAAEEQHYDIPAQSLATALATFANHSRVSVAYDADQIAKLRSAPARGRFTPQIALITLLKGTGLAARFTGPRSVILFDPRSSDAAAQTSAMGIATDRPTMNFDLAVVRAPRTIGQRDPVPMKDYLRRAENQVQAMFAGDPAYQRSAFDIRIALAVTANGTIDRVELVRPSGNTDRDALVRDLVLGRNLGAPPAEGVGRPLQFHITGRDVRATRDSRP